MGGCTLGFSLSGSITIDRWQDVAYAVRVSYCRFPITHCSRGSPRGCVDVRCKDKVIVGEMSDNFHVCNILVILLDVVGRQKVT